MTNRSCILILSYNHPEITARTIRSVQMVSILPILLVHNGSELFHIQKLEKEFPGIEHIVLNSNRGFSGGANYGFQHAFKDYDSIIFLTNDCTVENLPQSWDENSLLLPKILHKKSERIDAVGGYFIPHKGEINHCRNIDDFESILLNVKNKRPFVRVLPYAPAVAFGISKKIFEEVGGFDESFGTYWEDVDWSQKILSIGFKMQVSSNWMIRHMVGKTCHKHSLYSLYYFQRNRKKVSWKYCANYLKPLLIIQLVKIWTKTFLRLIVSKRYQDLKLLYRVVFE